MQRCWALRALGVGLFPLQLASAVLSTEGTLAGLRRAGTLGAYSRQGHRHGMIPTANICADGKLLPELYLLGAQKSATRAYAEDMAHLGISNAGVWKEFHFWDKEWNSSNPTSEDDFKLQRSAWLDLLPDCTNGTRAVLADYTPSNLRLVPLPKGTKPTGSHWGLWFLGHNATDDVESATHDALNLPFALQTIYGEALSARLTLVVLLREPLARMQSAWYAASSLTEENHNIWQQCHDCKAHSFIDALERTVKKAEKSPPVYDDWLWTSMYARHLDAWLTHFAPQQLYIVPYKFYVEGGDNRTQVCWDIMRRLDFQANCTRLQTLDAVPKANKPPALEDENIPKATLSSFNHIMDAENKQLVTLLAEAWSRGTELALFRGLSGSRREVQEWLEDGWV